MCVVEVSLRLQNHAQRPVQVLVDSSKSSDRSVMACNYSVCNYAVGLQQWSWKKII